MKLKPRLAKYTRRLIGLGVLPLLIAAGPGPAERNQKGIAAYESGDYEEALRIYTDTLVDVPESPELHFNIGAANFKLEHYDQAMEEFRSVLASGQKELIAKAHYNIGNCLYRQAEQAMTQGSGEEVIRKYEAAVQSYIEALKIDPDDVQAKRNIELIRRKIKEMLDRQQQQQPQPQDQEQTQDQQQQQTGTPQEEQEDQQSNAGQATPTPQEPSESESQQSPPGQPTPVYMTPDEAERLLESLDEEKREEMQEQMRRIRERAGVEADW